jgi:hypothetical protein
MAKTGKNTHMTHLEEAIITDGHQGGLDAINLLKEMGNFLTGTGGRKAAVTVKWDGAPAVICGTDPSDGQFFVGTKSVFAQQPKLMKTPKDITENYSGALAEKLISSLQYLSKCNIKGVLQGDLMFTNDKKTQQIDGKSYITFRPNTITYAADPKSKLGKEIHRANLGIVFHTKYTGPSLAEMQASFGVKESDFSAAPGVWIATAEFKDIGGIAQLSGGEKSKYDAAVRRAEGSLRQSRKILNAIQSGKKTLQVDTEFLKFFNNYVKEGRPIPSVEQAYQDFFYHMGREYEKKIKPLKTLKSQEAKVTQFVNAVQFLEDNQKELKMAIACYMNLQFCKHILVDKMKRVSDLHLFVDMGGGDYKVTTPEGFVGIRGRTALKLVDRLEFSRLNFTVPKQWDK